MLTRDQKKNLAVVAVITFMCLAATIFLVVLASRGKRSSYWSRIAFDSAEEQWIAGDYVLSAMSYYAGYNLAVEHGLRQPISDFFQTHVSLPLAMHGHYTLALNICRAAGDFERSHIADWNETCLRIQHIQMIELLCLEDCSRAICQQAANLQC